MRGVIAQVSTLITPPAKPPMTIAYAKKHIKALGSAEDVLIEQWIEARGLFVEEYSGIQLITATREIWMDAFPTGSGSQLRIELPRPPLQSVVSVEYVDGNGDLQPVSDGGSPEVLGYVVKAPVGPYAQRGWIEPLYGTTWPIARAEGGAVRVRYNCGFGDTPTDVPALLTGAICALVALDDQVRSAVHPVQSGQMVELPFGVTAILDAFKYSALPQQVHRSATSVGVS